MIFCEECKFFDEDRILNPGMEGDGYCREDSPKITPPGILGKHPRVFKNGGCGKGKKE